MSCHCEHCPCDPSAPCYGPTTHPHFCRWARAAVAAIAAATGPIDPIHRSRLALIRDRSRLPYDPPRPGQSRTGPGAEADAHWARYRGRDRFAADRLIARCPARVRDPSCGCAGRGCALLGRPIDIEDCLSCVAPLVAAFQLGLPAPRREVDAPRDGTYDGGTGSNR